VFSFKVFHRAQLVGVWRQFHKSGGVSVVVFAGDITCLDLVSPVARWLPYHRSSLTVPVFGSSAVPRQPQRESLSKVMISY